MGKPKKSDPISTSALINPKDFSSIHVTIKIINVTTQTRLENGSIFYGQKVVDSGPHCTAEILEFLEEGVVMDIPNKLGTTGHVFTIKVTTQGASNDLSVEFNSVVSKVEKNQDRSKCTLKNQQHKDSEFKKLVTLFESRQQEIADFFEAVKGY